MTNLEIVTNYEREINKLDDTFGKPDTSDSLYWLNQAVNKFIKLRFNGDFTHRTSYEQNEKRRQDLLKLYQTEELTQTAVDVNTDYTRYVYNYPTEMMYVLNEDVEIGVGDDSKSVSVFECTSDSFMYRMMNSLTDFHLHRGFARPLRVFSKSKDEISLYTDGKYTINKYTIGYLKHPTEIDLVDKDAEYDDFDDATLYEIIKMAAQMWLENQKDERYKTITNEVVTQE